MTKEYRELYTEIVKKVFRNKWISIEEIEKLIEYAFNEGYNQCMLDEIKIDKMKKDMENEREIDE